MKQAYYLPRLGRLALLAGPSCLLLLGLAGRLAQPAGAPAADPLSSARPARPYQPLAKLPANWPSDRERQGHRASPVLADTAGGALAGILADVRHRSFFLSPARRASLTAGNYRQHLAATLEADHYTVAADTARRGGPAWQVTFALRGIGRGRALAARPLADTTAGPIVAGGHATYQQPGFAVDYDNTEAGVRQTYHLAARPTGNGPVQVRLALTTALRARPAGDSAVVFSAGQSHAPVLRYGSLRAWDATGRRLPATMRLAADGTALALVVDDARAAYPLTIDPLASTAGTTLSGGAAGDTYATSVALVGDLDGDGYGDLAVGAPGYSGGAGAVYLYRGSSTGLGTTAATLLQGSGTDNYGASVAGAGDFNGDGYGDLLTGAPGYGGGIGVAYVYGGSPSFFTNPLATAVGRAGYAASRGGTAVAGVGDVNGDGYDDVAYGCPAYSSNAGDVALIFGNSSFNVNITTDFQGSGGIRLGASLTGLGDLNGDGYADLAAGAPAANAVLVVRGANATLASGLSNFLLQPGGAGTGTSVAGPGDVNGDGYADLLIGAPGAGTGGRVYVYQGSTTLAASTAPTATLNNPNAVAGDLFGQAVSGAGDTNGDGYADFAVGSPGYSGSTGRAYVYVGMATAGPYVPAQTYTGETPGDRYGASLSGGDANGDGYGDLLAGAPANSSSTGRAYAYYGSPVALLTTPATTFADPGATAYDFFGNSVASAGDVNGDGYADVLMGAQGVSNSQGRAYLYLGSSTGLAATPTTTLTEPNPAGGNQFGTRLASAGDVNGDGYADVLIGAYGTGNKGQAYLYLGSSTGLATTPAVTFIEPNAAVADGFGIFVASAGDVNGDGYSDVLIGAYGTSGSQGRAYFYLGSSTGPAATPTTTLIEPNAASNDQFGRAGAGAGDVNGDGYADVIIGAYGTSGGQGRAYLYLGSSSGLAATPTTLAEPTANATATSSFGRTVASAGDVNGDGYTDVLVGAPGATTSASRAYLYLGSSSGPATTPAVTFADPNAANGDFFGFSVASAGDVNGDGYADVLLGAYGSSSQGQAYLYLGSGSGPAATPTTTFAEPTPSAANGNQFGYNVATAGDANGDSYADVLIGARSTSSGKGQVYAYLGNQGAARAGGLRLYDTDYTPISADNLGNNQFGLGLTARNSSGRIQARVVWEVVGRGQSFSHASPLANSTAYSGRGPWTNLPASGTPTELRALVNKASRASKVRARLEYASSPLATGPRAGTGGPASRVRYGPWTYVAAQQAGQSSSAAMPLPVVLTAFTATPAGPAAVALAWATASETNSARFEVQRSADGTTWVTLGAVAAAGTSATTRSYGYLDGAALAGTGYYRLRQVDQDGTTAYSAVVPVTLGGSGGLALYPNPAHDGAATLTGAAPGVMVQVLDALGRVAATATVGADGTVALSGLPRGLYVVRSGSGGVRLVVK